MELLEHFWGLSLNQTILLSAAILIVADFFIPTDALSLIAYVILSAMVAINVDSHLLVRILSALLSWFIFVAFHYWIWRSVIQKFTNAIIAPDRFKTGADGLVGEKGIIRDLEGTKMANLKGDLWPCHGASQLPDGSSIVVIFVHNGILEVRPIPSNS